MKFSAVAVPCLATGAYARMAEPPTRVLRRDIATITGAVEAVGKDIGSLDSAVSGFSGDIKPVTEAADKLIATLKDSETKVQGSDKLEDLKDALGLQKPVEGLQSKSEALVSNLKSHKSDVEKTGSCELLRTKLGAIESGSLALIEAVTSKVPDAAKPVAEQLSSGLKKVLASAKADFSTENCKSSGGASSSAGAPPSSSATSAEPSSPASSAKPSSPVTSAEPSSPASTAEPSSPASTGAVYPVPGSSTGPAVHPTGTGAPATGASGQPPVRAGAAALVPGVAMVMAAAVLVL